MIARTALAETLGLPDTVCRVGRGWSPGGIDATGRLDATITPAMKEALGNDPGERRRTATEIMTEWLERSHDDDPASDAVEAAHKKIKHFSSSTAHRTLSSSLHAVNEGMEVTHATGASTTFTRRIS